MLRTLLKSKIHRATVTDANLEYEGSLTLDPLLMEAAEILPYERIEVYNLENGERFATYVIPGERGKGEVVLNGAAAHLARRGNLVILCTYVQLPEEEARGHQPTLVYVDKKNRVVEPRPAGVTAGRASHRSQSLRRRL